MDLSVYVDGASRGNPGPAAAGVVIREMTTENPIHEAGYRLANSTNNVAEYRGLIRALEVVRNIPQWRGGDVAIYSDSQLMVRQITGEYRVKSADLQPLLQDVQILLVKLGAWRIRHVPREQNKRADELANLALDAGRDVIVLAGDGSKATGPAGGAASGGAKGGAATASSSSNAGLQWHAWLLKSPGAKCPAKCPAKTPFIFGPATPAGFCIHAAQAVFDENPTLWADAGRSTAQTECQRCGATIEVEAVK